MRNFFAPALALPICLAVGTIGCLGSYQGSTSPDLAQSSDPADDPPVGDPSPPAPLPDLAGSVQVDMFVSSGTAGLSLSSNTETLRLNEAKDITVTVNGNGAAGSATLSLKNAPAGLTATFNPATIILGPAPIPVTMTVKAAPDMDPATSVAAAVELNAAGALSSTTFGITVMPELLITIAKGVALTNNPTAFGLATIPMKLIGTGTKITFVNQDAIQHRIHADGTGGLDHEANNMAANGGTYSDTITAVGTISFNCHIHGGMKGKLDVK